MRTNRDTRGFALPLAVFALVVVGVLVTSGFFLARQETRVSVAGEAAVRALYIAEQGLNQVRLNWNPPIYNEKDLWSDTTLTGSVDDGEWTVVVTKTDSTNYFLESTGVVTGGGHAAGATRRVGMLARVMYPTIDPPAAMTTAGGAEVRGLARVDGNDQTLTGRDCPPTDNKPGILAKDATQVNVRGNADLQGNPPLGEDPSIGAQTFEEFGEVTYDQLAAMASIDFGSATVNPSPTVRADGNCDYSDSQNWGDPENPTAACGDYYPIIHFSGDASIQSNGSGQGVLLVDGNLQIQGTFSFYGIIIVQGSLATRGSGNTAPRIVGGVYTANADIETSGSAGASQIISSTCAVQEANRKSFTASRPLPTSVRSWVDLSGVSY